MTPSAQPRRRPVWRWVLGSFAVAGLLLVFAVVNVVTLGRDARALRRAVADAGGFGLTTRVQLSAGPLLLSLGRAVASAVGDVPEEAREALAAVRRSSVGVYRIASRPDDGRDGWMAGAEVRLQQRGWQRLVAARSAEHAVVVYAPEEPPTRGPMKVCVAVCDRNQLVVVSATIEPAALARLVESRL